MNFRLSTIYIGTSADVFIGTFTDNVIFVIGTATAKGKMKTQIERVDVNKLPKSVSQPYLLTKNFDFNIHESRIVIRVLQQIKQHQFIKLGSQIDLDNNVVMRFRPKDLTVGNDLNLVYKALGSIRNKEIILNGTATDDGEEVETRTITGFINEATYAVNNSFVDIKINADWFKMLVDLSKGYTPYLSNVGFQTGNRHHLIIYQYICHWYKKGSLEGLELNENQIRENFQIHDKYDDLRKIVTRVIDPCKKELDTFSDKSFNFTLNRITPGATRGRGAKIKSITFKFYETNKVSKNVAYEPKRTAIKISEFTRMYGLSSKDEAMLGGLAKKYDSLLYVRYRIRKSTIPPKTGIVY